MRVWCLPYSLLCRIVRNFWSSFSLMPLCFFYVCVFFASWSHIIWTFFDVFENEMRLVTTHNLAIFLEVLAFYLKRSRSHIKIYCRFSFVLVDKCIAVKIDFRCTFLEWSVLQPWRKKGLKRVNIILCRVNCICYPPNVRLGVMPKFPSTYCSISLIDAFGQCQFTPKFYVNTTIFVYS